MTQWRIPFTRVHLTGKELDYLREAVESRQLAGDGSFTRRCHRWLEEATGCHRALLTPSGTAALEIAAIVAGIEPGDEVIMPSFTFPSTANAFVLRGAIPVFVDIEPRTFNIDPDAVAAAVTPRTRAIVPVHYAGTLCDMDAIGAIARDAGVVVIEDAAQALLSARDSQQAGTFGALAALSFHQTKNITAGEAGAILINDPSLVERAEIVREKGTDRSRFFRGEVDKYTWVDIGSSYLPGELIAAFLLAQLEDAERITRARKAVWDRYHELLAPFEEEGLLVRPHKLSQGANAHIYSVLLPSLAERTHVIEELKRQGIGAVFHYVPLHSSPAGLKYCRTSGPLRVTDEVSERLVRLPIWSDMTEADVDLVTAALGAALRVPARRS